MAVDPFLLINLIDTVTFPEGPKGNLVKTVGLIVFETTSILAPNVFAYPLLYTFNETL